MLSILNRRNLQVDMHLLAPKINLLIQISHKFTADLVLRAANEGDLVLYMCLGSVWNDSWNISLKFSILKVCSDFTFYSIMYLF